MGRSSPYEAGIVSKGTCHGFARGKCFFICLDLTLFQQLSVVNASLAIDKNGLSRFFNDSCFSTKFPTASMSL